MPDNNAIVLNDVTLAFSPKTGVHNLNLSIPSGTIFGLIGPSGSGKTTAIRLMLGLLEPQAGEVQVLNTQPLNPRRGFREDVGYMPQHLTLYPNLSVVEILRFVAALYGLGMGRRRKHIRASLDLVELSDARRRLVRDLSGGMQRRLLLATALLHDPSLIFADEPTAGLDPILRDKIWDHFNHLKNEGKTLFVTTQIMEEAVNCDIVGLMVDGRLITVQSPAHLRAQSLGSRIIHLRVARGQVQQVSTLLAHEAAIQSFSQVEDEPGLFQIYVHDKEDAVLNTLLKTLYQDEVQILQVEHHPPSFNEVFAELVRRERNQRV